jgi:hypothetical protein
LISHALLCASYFQHNSTLFIPVIAQIFKEAMPLYTYIANHKGGTYVDQDTRSNFKGFAALMIARWPADCLPGFNATLQKEAANQTARAEWNTVAGRSHVWVTQFNVSGNAFTLHAVQTMA